MEPHSIPVLSSQIILVPAPHQEQTQVSEGFGSAMAEPSPLQPPSLQPCCCSLAVQPTIEVTVPPRLVPGTLPRLGPEQPLLQCWDSGLLQTGRVLLVGFTAGSAQELGNVQGCASRVLELYFGVFSHMASQAKHSSSGAYLPAAAAMTDGGDSRSHTPLAPSLCESRNWHQGQGC